MSCEATERITEKMAKQMTREDALRALQNLIEIQKDIHSQMDILRERIWPGCNNDRTSVQAG